MAFGGGNLQNFGINSNTSANGFLKCLYRRKLINEQGSNSPQKTSVKRLVPLTDNQTVVSRSPDVKSIKSGQVQQNGIRGGLDEGSSDEEAGPAEARVELVALPPFKNLYKSSPIV